MMMLLRALPLIRNNRRNTSVALLSGFVLATGLYSTRVEHLEGRDRVPFARSNGTALDKLVRRSREGEEEREAVPLEDDAGEALTWTALSSRFLEAGSAISSIEWSSIGSSIKDYILPDWVLTLPAYITKLQHELNMGPGSLSQEIWSEASDVYINPEIDWDARVRISRELCDQEKAFIKRRKRHTTKALARYLGVLEADLDPEDVPTIAMCGSGGGLRALLAGASSYICAQEAGLFDCVTYTAGLSGSCWLQTLYYSTLTGQNHKNIIKHLKKRLGVHFAFPPTALNLLTTAPTNKFLLAGLVEKAKGDPSASFGLVDVYGLLLAARLLVPKDELSVSDRDLKLSNQRTYVDNGTHPLPIYSAVRHEIPLDEVETLAEKASGHPSEATKEEAKREAWFQWFEFTPYEFWAEELDAGIPTWSLGRKFAQGVNVRRDNGLNLPELRVPQLMAIWGSAFCATVSHYYEQVRPMVQTYVGFTSIDDLIRERNEDLVKVHPIEPASIPNYVLGLRGQLPSTCPESLHHATHLQLMDAGMSNNLPIYPLLRPGRDVDIIIAFDASADLKKENWLSVADGYARQRGVRGWPVGVGWPRAEASEADTVQALDAAQAHTAQEAAIKLAEVREQNHRHANETESAVAQGRHIDPQETDLGYCTVWIGSTQERSSPSEPPLSKRRNPDADEDWRLLDPDSGIAIVYFPFLPNAKVEGVDPNTSEFMSTWNSVYTPDQIDTVVALARANFEEGAEQTKRCIRAVYERKRRQRLEREKNQARLRWMTRMRSGSDQFR